MNIKRLSFFWLICCVSAAAFGQQQKPGTINRKVLVQRHNLCISDVNDPGPTQVGNGNFAYNFDITGMQSLSDEYPILSQWSWHSVPTPNGMKPEDFKKPLVETNGRKIPYEIPNPQQAELSNWLEANPHRFNLGRIGLWVDKPGDGALSANDIKDPVQTLDMWTGTAVSTFRYKGSLVKVVTVADPKNDVVSFRIESSLLLKKKIGVFIDFPYANLGFGGNASDYKKVLSHQTNYKSAGNKKGTFYRKMDSTVYAVTVSGSGFNVSESRKHRYKFTSTPANAVEYSFCFTPENKTPSISQFGVVKHNSELYWPQFWKSGAAIDLSRSKDPRWKELERRLVLSQYLMKINASGKYPPQETGLVSNSWYGRFHYEMIWWHNAHYTLWNRWGLLNNSIHVYSDNLEKARQRATLQGYEGARFPKCTGPDGREWPHPIHAFLVWQQPHPIFFAAMDYRAHPDKKTWDKWSAVVEGSADFLASYAFKDSVTNKYVLGTPIAAVPEVNDYYKDKNPAFELGYWRFGLRTANWLRQQQGLAINQKWKKVYDDLAPIPENDGVYEQWENAKDMWTKFNFEHPALLGVYGLLPGDGVNLATMNKTYDRVKQVWRFDTGWGWDFPLIAMTAARLGRPSDAIDMLLYDIPKNKFNAHGMVGGGVPYPYFPTNGGLLYAVAMMTAGWDGDKGQPEPGFPKDGNWVVRWEGLKKAP